MPLALRFSRSGQEGMCIKELGLLWGGYPQASEQKLWIKFSRNAIHLQTSVLFNFNRSDVYMSDSALARIRP
ncbi:protein of unknown function [Paraburkholderia dioscoreae]|uniref:Uncharacterized protein n=1 Tax=Paraburkholderia dioscoreae TaxID=2604047 RepID=A0A5Q4ZIG0_9BURK|nr:protein of unknown function [Paraburkholderia dioscoreae]